LVKPFNIRINDFFAKEKGASNTDYSVFCHIGNNFRLFTRAFEVIWLEI